MGSCKLLIVSWRGRPGTGGGHPTILAKHVRAQILLRGSFTSTSLPSSPSHIQGIKRYSFIDWNIAMKCQKKEAEAINSSEQKQTRLFNFKPLFARVSYISFALLWLLRVDPSVAASSQSAIPGQHPLLMLKGVKWQKCGDITNHTVECEYTTV